MSKKIASGADKIVIDATVGSGAFMKDIHSARILAKTMKEIGKEVGKETVCVLTNMDSPLGTSVGNSLEIIEVVDALQGNIEEDVKEVILEIGSYIIKLAGAGEDLNQNKNRILESIASKKGYDKFIEMVKLQGGDISYIEEPTKFEKAKYVIPVLSENNGFVEKINAEIVGSISVYLGAGRMKKEDIIDSSVRNSFKQKNWR